MASIVLVGGTAIQPSPRPCTLSNRSAEWISGNVSACLDAPAITPSTPELTGQATLCNAGRDLRVSLRVDSLTPGVVYTAWLGSFDKPASCEDPSCEYTAVIPVILLDARRVGEGAALPSQTLEIGGVLRDVRLVSGGQVMVMLLQPGGRPGPHAQAVFTLP
jgi:hypothetical protein